MDASLAAYAARLLVGTGIDHPLEVAAGDEPVGAAAAAAAAAMRDGYLRGRSS